MNYKTTYPVLWGGLGNQLFIYAAARAHAIRTSSRLLINVDEFQLDTLFRRTNRLHFFKMGDCCDRTHARWLAKFFRWRDKKIRHFLYFCVVDRPSRGIIRFPQHWFGRLWLSGYWQSERYFEEFADVIARDLQVADASLLVEDPVAKEIAKEPDSAFVHLRSFHDIPGYLEDNMPDAFYAKAMRIIIERSDSVPHFFLFSDKIDYAYARLRPIAESLGVKLTKVVSTGANSDILDIERMRLCRHGILANSSFSWWAAWRSERENLKAGVTGVFVHQDGLPFAYSNPYFWPDRWQSV